MHVSANSEFMTFSHILFEEVRVATTRMLYVGIIGGLFVCGNSPAQTNRSSLSAHGSSAQRTSATSKTTFKVKNMGELMTDYGIPMGFSNFTAPDGIGILVLYLRQDDRSQALRAFEHELDRATKIIKRGEKKDRNGKVVGARVELLMPSALSTQSDYAVIWTDGPTFHEIVSNSLQDTLELEKVYRY
jgi:hypothetical protein